MIRSSVLAVPRRTPMLAAKAAVFAAVAFVVGELLAFVSFLIAQAIIRSHMPVSLGDPAVLRAVFGMGLYLTVLGLLGLAIGALVRHTAAALTVVVGVVVVLSNLARTAAWRRRPAHRRLPADQRGRADHARPPGAGRPAHALAGVRRALPVDRAAARRRA